MEVQTFMLCKELRKTGEGSAYDATMLGLHSFFARDEQLPLTFQMPYFMLLRRADRGAEKAISLHMRLIDQDGRAAGEPGNLQLVGQFPPGAMFITLHGVIPFSFPKLGDYRLDVTADKESLPSVYQYDIEILRHP